MEVVVEVQGTFELNGEGNVVIGLVDFDALGRFLLWT